MYGAEVYQWLLATKYRRNTMSEAVMPCIFLLRNVDGIQFINCLNLAQNVYKTNLGLWFSVDGHILQKELQQWYLEPSF